MRELGPSPAYKERRADLANRVHCDFCARCFVYNCDGSTARHYDIHLSVGEYFALTDEELNAQAN